MTNGGHHHLFHLAAGEIGSPLESHRSAFLNEARANVRSHDDDRVLEIDRVSQRVGENAVFKDLQQNVVNVRVSLFHFVEQQN